MLLEEISTYLFTPTFLVGKVNATRALIAFPTERLKRLLGLLKLSQKINTLWRVRLALKASPNLA